MKFFSSISIDTAGDLKGLETAIASTIEQGAKSLLILICSENSIDLNRIPELLEKLHVPAFAGIVPGLISNSTRHYRGSMVVGFNTPVKAKIFEDIHRSDIDLPNQINSWLEHSKLSGAVILIDGQSQGIDHFVSAVYNALGPDPSVMGAGLGRLDLKHQAPIITPAGLIKNAAILFDLPAPLTIGARHGWQSVAGPYLVTESEGNLIHSINYQPALSFYLDTISEITSSSRDELTFESVSKSYPFGITQLDSEFLVRDPVQHVGESLVCAGGIAPNTTTYILYAEKCDLINAALSAVNDCKNHLSPEYLSNQEYYCFIIDCISRSLLLDEEYPDELAAITEALPNNTPLAGILSLGEIATSSQGLIQFMNKSTVIGGAVL